MRHVIAYELKPTKDGRIIAQGAIVWPDDPILVTKPWRVFGGTPDFIGKAADFRREPDLSITAEISLFEGKARFDDDENFRFAFTLRKVQTDEEDGVMVVRSGVLMEVTVVPKEHFTWDEA